MLGGGLSGFVMKLIAAQMQSQTAMFERMLAKQTAADDSADRAAQREGGVLVRRFLVVCTMFAIVVAPFVFAFTDVGVSIQNQSNGFLGLFKSVRWETVQGFVILPETDCTRNCRILFRLISSKIRTHMYGRKTNVKAGKGSCGERGGCGCGKKGK
jgi:hypothetical protein